MNKIKFILDLLIKLITIFVISNYLFAKIDKINNFNQENYFTTNQVTRTMSNINNWGYWIYYDGKSAHEPDNTSGGIYPRGTAGAIYMDGLVWGGNVDTTGDRVGDDIRVGGQTYIIGTQPGCIEVDGTATDATDPKVKVYRIRSDWETLTGSMVIKDAMELNELSSLSSVTESMTDAVIDQYEEDWNEWPVDLGAPWTDVDDDGEYDPTIDKPGIAGADQVIWLVVNDLSATRTLGLYGSLPIGLELQITIWAYNLASSKLRQMIFKKYRLINKSSNYIEEMYVSQWSDPDIGDYGDDFVGCDTTLSMGFAYNGADLDLKYAAFGLAPAAVGYDLLQGPIVESQGDTAIFDFKKIPNYKNLGMTSFGWYTAVYGGVPPLGNYEGTRQWYNMLRGFKPFDNLANPVPWTEGNIVGGTPTKFPLSGDPVSGIGFIDGKDNYYEAGDRRMAINSGPFNLAPGDTQELVIALIGGLGDSRLNSLSNLKETDKNIQKIYDDLFTSSNQALKKPLVEATAFENEIILEWGLDSITTSQIENSNYIGYKFEGYNIYQLPSEKSNLDEATRIATYDIVNNVTLITSTKLEVYYYNTLPEYEFQYGTDSGIKRFIHIDKNYLNNSNLVEGQTYYFAVTAYSHNDEFKEKFYESSYDVISVKAQEPLPGNSVPYSHLDTIGYSHIQGFCDNSVLIQVINPTKTTGHDYEIFFTYNVDSSKILWNVKDVTIDSVIVSNQEQKSDFTSDDDQPIFDGLQVKVVGPKPGVKKVYETDANDVVLDEGVTAFGDVNIASPSLGTTGYLLSNIAGSINNTDDSRDWDRFNNWGTADFEIDFSASSLTWDYSSESVHFDSLDSSPYYAPFAVYRTTVEGNRYRLFAGFWDTDSSGTWNNATDDAGDPRWEGPIYNAPSYEPIYCWQGYDASGNDISYDPINEATYISDNDLLASANTTWDGGTGDIHYPLITAMLFTEYAGGPPIGNKVWFITNKLIMLEDRYTFSTIAPKMNDIELAKVAAEKINVYPNPYYAHNPLAMNRSDEYVTFTHLPANAKISIYNLAGVLVKKIVHYDPTNQFVQWDLTNSSQKMLVASGLYIAYIELPDLGISKTLKFFIIQRE